MNNLRLRSPSDYVRLDELNGPKPRFLSLCQYESFKLFQRIRSCISVREFWGLSSMSGVKFLIGDQLKAKVHLTRNVRQTTRKTRAPRKPQNLDLALPNSTVSTQRSPLLQSNKHTIFPIQHNSPRPYKAHPKCSVLHIEIY